MLSRTKTSTKDFFKAENISNMGLVTEMSIKIKLDHVCSKEKPLTNQETLETIMLVTYENFGQCTSHRSLIMVVLNFKLT